VDSGADVVCLVRDWVPRSEAASSGLLEKVTVVRGDVSDQGLLERVLGEYEITTVFHLAAQAIVGVANRNPVSTYQSNVSGTWALLEACRRSPTVRQVVVASSDKAYGEHAVLPYDEDAPLKPLHPYDVSKACADLIAQSYAATYSLPVVITRCGNFFGGGDLNWNRLVPGTIRSLLRGERPIVRSDGTFVRDYFYVEDGAAAYMLAAERLLADRSLGGRAFNFSYERPLSVLDMVARVAAAVGVEADPDIRNEASHEIPRQYLSAARARRDLGWTPAHTFEHALARTVDWYRRLLGPA
jgi:CDP-glucose 4,6-dehydratase